MLDVIIAVSNTGAYISSSATANQLTRVFRDLETLDCPRLQFLDYRVLGDLLWLSL